MSVRLWTQVVLICIIVRVSHTRLDNTAPPTVSPSHNSLHPQYIEWWDKLTQIGERQSKEFILTSYLMPEVSNNPSITPWLFDDDPLHPNYLISWCSKVYACMYYVASMEYDFNRREVQFKVVKKMDCFEYFDNHEGLNRRPLQDFSADIRLYNYENTTKLTYNMFRGDKIKAHDTYISQLFYHKKLDALYILNDPVKANISNEFEDAPQKNWSPFLYQPTISYSNKHSNGAHHQINNHHNKVNDSRKHSIKHLNNGTHATSSHRKLNTIKARTHSTLPPVELFVHSVHPHRIVHNNETIGNQTFFHTVSATRILLPPGQKDFWNYGEARGGTPSVLINTKYGPRYLTFFHSQGRFANHVLAYYFGAYIFEASPPFAITHMTVDPIIPLDLYNQTRGWAWKYIDFIVFPIGLIVKDEVAFVTMGRNDRAGWIVVMNISGLVDSLTSVRSKTLSNNFHTHFKYSNLHLKSNSSGMEI